MSKCFSFTDSTNWWLRSSFKKSGLVSTVVDLKDGTVMHCWVPNDPGRVVPSVVLIHGLGANALWQWAELVWHLAPQLNLYVPDLVFFGQSHTTRAERGEQFQAECVMRALEAQWAEGGNGPRTVSVVGLSYGGFVAYSMAAQFKEVVAKVVICGAGVSMEESDIHQGLFPVSDLELAAEILVPQTPGRLRELLGYTMFRPSLPLGLLPSCLLSDFIDAMCTDYLEEKRDLVRAIARNRKFSDLPKITQPTLIIWGEYDQIFPLELAHRLKRHLGENSQLIVIKKAGHGINLEKPKEFLKHLKSFLVDNQPSLTIPSSPYPQNHK